MPIVTERRKQISSLIQQWCPIVAVATKNQFKEVIDTHGNGGTKHHRCFAPYHHAKPSAAPWHAKFKFPLAVAAPGWYQRETDGSWSPARLLKNDLTAIAPKPRNHICSLTAANIRLESPFNLSGCLVSCHRLNAISESNLVKSEQHCLRNR